MKRNPEKLDELYQKAVEELLMQTPVSFDALCQFAAEVLQPKVRYWCSAAGLKDQRYEEDLMQEIHIRLMLKSVSHFFMRENSREKALQKTRGEFTAWITRVAVNFSTNFFRKVNGKDSRVLDIDDPDLPGIGKWDDFGEEQEERIRKLRQAFAIVLSADVNIYKVLTWLAMAVTMLDRDLTKIKANSEILESFGDKTLWEMYTAILSCSLRIPWLEISDEQDDRIRAALLKEENGRSAGDMRYCEFFMKHNGGKSGKKSVSDWENRMNTMISDEMGTPPSDTKKEKKEKKPKKTGDSEQRETRGKNDDASSDN